MGRPELQWSDVGSEDPRRVTAARLRLLELVIRSARVLWKCSRSQLGTRVDGGEKIGRAVQLTVERLGHDSGEVEPDVGDGGLGEVPGAQAKLLRRLGLAVERRSSAGTAAQGLYVAMAWRNGVLGFWRPLA